VFDYIDNINSKYVLELLVSLTDLEKPIIVALMRTEMYSGWNAILDENGNAYETKMLCDFAKTYNIKGYVLTFLSPDIVCIHCLLINRQS